MKKKNNKKQKETTRVDSFAWIIRHKIVLLLSALFAIHIFFMFVQFQERFSFGWDQVDNAWAAKRILIEHKFPLIGMVAKQNSGFFIGPLYYYYVSIFYFFMNMHPYASGIIAGVTSSLSFFVLYYIIKKLFNEYTGIIAVCIFSISSYIIFSNRGQWPVNFILPISLAVFYTLFKVLQGEVKYMLLLGIVLGLSFHIHFTSIFYVIIIIACLPFFPWSLRFLKYSLASFVIFLLFLSPIFISNVLQNNAASKNLTNYISLYYHGFHLRRVLQLAHDAFVEIELILGGRNFVIFKYTLLPIFLCAFLYKRVSRNTLIFAYLVVLWFIVPWFVFATYRGEITNYYFQMERPIILIMLAYITMKIFSIPSVVPKLAILLFWGYFTYHNIYTFFHTNRERDYIKKEERIKQAIFEGRVIEWQEGVGESYIYEVYTGKTKIW